MDDLNECYSPIIILNMNTNPFSNLLTEVYVFILSHFFSYVVNTVGYIRLGYTVHIYLYLYIFIYIRLGYTVHGSIFLFISLLSS